ncbi:uncharacterized protein N7446_000269 [Penicillium canescens]|uniref:FAD-binding PCMH-type domain-containing protein n=1 Tax=Penicillium canescens TaxID=5083 RepID=A0AAD6N545_PENCN|nr:uncharacterized protein N7446_000269 [Penicillium canescens]KAJ6030669.1 hypothetical protein N7460_010935 [Penicillium canescens]KAJ6059615.1 hypothetical protein N7444_003254 [Penicillium canescens]KAJ6077333.1 hypothetical protein N7446_000269 [Penicillium canescens]
MKPAFIATLSAIVSASALRPVEPRQDATDSSSCIKACYRLARNTDYRTHFPGNGNLEVWDAKQQEVRSACRVQPTSTDDVADILRVILDTSCNFAVKSGGHARYPDDSVSVGGVTIDLQRMRSTEVSPDRKSVRLGAGHVLYSMFSDLGRHNLTTVGGRAGDVGIGGFVLGGGFSHLSPLYGLAKDNVFQYEIVLPNATVAIVNEHVHPNLYFALRGGMNNFGIVTYFTMRAVEQGQLYSGQKTYKADQRTAITDQAYELTTRWKNDTAMSFYYSFGYDQEADVYDLSITQTYAQPILDPPAFRELNQIPSESSTLRFDWLTEFSKEVASATPPGGRNLFATVTYSPSAELDREIQDIMVDEIQSIKGAPGFFPNLVIQPLYEGAIRAGKQRGGSAGGTEADGPLTAVLLTTLWNDIADDHAMTTFLNRWVQRSETATRDAGKYHPWRYINYASKEQDPFAGYGEESLQRLRRIQASIDPNGVFSSTGLCRGYFKLR